MSHLSRVESPLRLVRAPRRIAVPLWAAAVVAGWLALLGVYQAIKPATAPSLCMWREISGVPCPTCGSTRAFFAASHGRLGDAFLLNPLLGAAAAASGAWLILRLGFGRTLKLDLHTRGRRALWWAAAVLLVLNWAYVIARQQQAEAPTEAGRFATISASAFVSPPP